MQIDEVGIENHVYENSNNNKLSLKTHTLHASLFGMGSTNSNLKLLKR
jgi:hypothetical protein